MGDYVLEEHFEGGADGGRGGAGLGMVCVGLGVSGLVLVVLSFVR